MSRLCDCCKEHPAVGAKDDGFGRVLVCKECGVDWEYLGSYVNWKVAIPQKVTLAILQNQWGPEATKKKVERLKEMKPEHFATYVGYCLFLGCQTGQRLLKAFGEEACKSIVWTNASREAGTTSSAKFDADIQHLGDTIAHFKPDVVLVFGKVAEAGIEKWVSTLESAETVNRYPFLLGRAPHPAARMPDINQRLSEVAQRWREVTLDA